MFKLRTAFLFIIMLCFSTIVTAQSADEIRDRLEEARSQNREVRIELKSDGNTYIGNVESLTTSQVTVVNSSSSFTFKIDNIKSVIVIDPNKPETRWFKNNSRNRLFISPTAINNGAGTGYYQNLYIFLSNVSYSPTDFLTLNVGFSNIPRLTLDGDFFYLGAKINSEVTENLHLAVTGTLFSADQEQAGFVNILGTFTSNRLDLSGGLGYAIDDNEASSPLVFFGLQYRISQRASLVTENFVIPGLDGTVISVGPRFLGKRITTDLGYFFLPEAGADNALPFVSFTVAF